MPLEGQWERSHTPLRQLGRRERRVAAVALALTLAAILALVLVTLGGSKPRTAAGCIYAIVPGATGATAVSACGTAAKQMCAAHVRLTDPGSHAIIADCRRAGLLAAAH